jgi:hypothetical protein
MTVVGAPKTLVVVAGTLLVLGGVAAACQSGVEGTPVTSSEPTARPPKTVAPSTNPPTATAVPPADAEPLPPDQSGYVFIETKSGQTRCQIDEHAVGCEAPFTNTPIQDGVRANGVNLTADGAVQWIVGNVGDIPVVTIDYRTYTAAGWTIVSTTDGTRFTNQRTGHGMFVSIDNVETY